MSPAGFVDVFAELRDVLLSAAPPMVVASDINGALVLNAAWAEQRTGKPAFFGQVSIKKSYVAFHLMPLYYLPQLEQAIPERLAARRQGKTCFNVRRAEAAVFADLRRLTARCVALEGDWRKLLG